MVFRLKTADSDKMNRGYSYTNDDKDEDENENIDINCLIKKGHHFAFNL